MHESKKLSSRIAFWLAAASIAAALALVATFVVATARSFLDIEQKSVLSGLDRVDAAIQGELNRIASSAADYAVWDETFAFVNARGEESYIRDNLQKEHISNLDVDFVAVYGRGGTRLAEAGREGANIPDLPSRLDPASPVFAPSIDRKKGIAAIGGRAYAFAALPVLPSNGTGDGAGLFVFARELNDSFAEELSRLAGLPVSFETLGADAGAQARSVHRAGLKEPVVGTLRILDPFGKPLVQAATREDRVIFREGHKTILAMSLLALLILAGAGAGMKTALGLLVVKPMRRLEDALAQEGDIDDRFAQELERLSERSDAVGKTARIIAAAREALKQRIEQQISANERLETEVRARTGELLAANRELAVYQRVMQGTGEGVLITDIDGAIRRTNQAFRDMSGYSDDELLGRNPRMLKSDRHDKAFFDAMWEAILSQGRWSGEVWNKHKNGSVYPVLLSIDTIRDEQGVPSNYVGITADIGKLKEAERNLNRMAFYDSLTDLPNRALFMDRFKQALARAQRSGSRVALVYLDLDRFKHVNDSLGHHAGDELLQKTAKRIQAQVREADTVCRIGGDEFTVILESIGSSSDAAAVARKIIAGLRASFTVEESEVFIGTSIGISLFPYDGTDADELIKKADAAMYEAKEHGRGQLRFASGQSGQSSTRRLEMETRIRKGLDKGEFYLTFQPQVSAGGASLGSSSGILGAEALIRWKPANRGVVSPDSFIDIAEESGLIVPLGSFVLNSACAEAKRWSDLGTPLQVSVNVSQIQFERGRIVEQVSEALAETGLEAKYLKLEITESLFTRDMDSMISIMREIRSGGVSFAVDDFGTGYSSLRYIDRLPIDSLKIDKSFIDRIASRYDGGEIATAVVALARSFGLESIAEGVETADQLDALRSRGCDAIQGYYVSKPLTSDDFRSFIAAKDMLAELSSPA